MTLHLFVENIYPIEKFNTKQNLKKRLNILESVIFEHYLFTTMVQLLNLYIF